MNNEWEALDSVPDTGFYAVVVTADGAASPIASGYAKSIAFALSRRNPHRNFIAVRMGQEGTGSAGLIENSELNALANWVEGNANPRREGNKPSSGLILYVERFDLVNDIAISLLAEAKSLGLDVIVIGGADSSIPPNPNALTSFPSVLLVNLPSKEGESIVTSEMRIR